MNTAIQYTPIPVDLTQVSKSTGWTISGNIASHESCNFGNIQLTGFTPIAGHSYQISYRVISISGGSVQAHIGTANGVVRTAVGDYTEPITATGISPIVFFSSDANCQVQAFNIRDSFTENTNYQKNTIVYSPVIKKWTAFYTMAPDYGFSMFIRTLLFKNGILYSQQNGSSNRNNLFGTAYESIFKFVENEAAATVKQYQSLSVQCNQITVTTTDGIQTSLGQTSELGVMDFLKDNYNDSIIQVSVYNKEGVYSACFLKDKNEDLINGSPLKGNYATIELTTTATKSDTPLRLFTVVVVSTVSKIGAR